MGFASFPAASSGISVSDGNTAGWNLGVDQYELISEYRSTTQVNQFTFSSIPQTYRKLVVDFERIEERSNNSMTIWMRFNSDSNYNYASYGYQTTTQGASTKWNPWKNQNSNAIYINNEQVKTLGFVSGRFEILNYATTNPKIIQGIAHYEVTGGYGTINEIRGAVYRTALSTNAITTLQIGANNNLSTQIDNMDGIRLYGVK